MPWELGIGLFLLGAATGGWWSRRRAVARAVSSALSAASAQSTAQASGGHVYINGAPDSIGTTADDYDNDYHSTTADDALQRSPDRGRGIDTASWDSDDGGRVGNPGQALDKWFERPPVDDGHARRL